MDEEWRWCEDGEVIPEKCHRIRKMCIRIYQSGSLRKPKHSGISGLLERRQGMKE